MSIVYTTETGVPTELEREAQQKANAKKMRLVARATAEQIFERSAMGRIVQIDNELYVKRDNRTATLADFEHAIARIVNLSAMVKDEQKAEARTILAFIESEAVFCKRSEASFEEFPLDEV